MDSITESRIENKYHLYGLSSSKLPEEIRYVGYSKCPTERLKSHIRDCNRVNVKTHKKNWINQEIALGNQIIMTILGSYNTHEEIILAEINTIKKFTENGIKLVNGTTGGDGVICTEDIRAKMSIASRGRKHSSTAKQKMSESRKGKKHSEETKQKMSESRKGKCGRVWTESEKNKLSAKLKGRESKLKGKTISNEIKKKISITKTGVPSKKRKIVQQFDKNDNLIATFSSLNEAEKITKINNIHRCIMGGRKTAGGYKWKYKIEFFVV